ncbi:MAG: nucleotide exchange factor GrpE [Polyangiaceae bacterium]
MHDESKTAVTDEGPAEESPAGEAQADPPSSVRATDPLSQAQAEAAKLKDAWLRTAADFDNFRKRTRKEIEEARRAGREDLLRAVLPVFDNLERAIQSAQRAADVKAVADGLALVLRQFTESLAREGIARVPTVGHPFDPSVHEAIQQVETADHEPGTVLAEVQPGYMQGERLVRAAMVVVAKVKGGAGDGGPDRAAS